MTQQNREIKFRAWQPRPSFLRKPGVYRVSTLDFYQANGGGEALLIGENRQSSAFFEDIILMQYTGLKDKNGVEIYEGDIVQGGSRLPDQVIFRDGMFQTAGGYRILYTDAVIGNIYENPEPLGDAA